MVERLQSSSTQPERIGLHHLLGRLPRDVSRKLLAGERPLKLREGEMLFERGDTGDGCYWLRRGVLAVYVASATAPAWSYTSPCSRARRQSSPRRRGAGLSQRSAAWKAAIATSNRSR